MHTITGPESHWGKNNNYVSTEQEKRKRMSDWEPIFRSWACPPSKTEEQRCQNAESMIRNAIESNERLNSLNIDVAGQGSYKANTNVRLDSDVDVRVSYNEVFYYDLENGVDKGELGLEGASVDSLSPSQFKLLIWEALRAKFGDGVEWGSKAFKVKENSYRIVSDVVPTTQYRRYYRDQNGTIRYHRGVVLYPDSGPRIINWPDQTLRNGIDRNNLLGRRYKSVIRIIKRLRNNMQEEGISEANNIASFLIECLVWNSPNWCFGHELIAEDVKKVLGQVWYESLEARRCSEWGEVNELKYLFRESQPWTIDQASNFLWSAKQYLGF